MGWQWHQLDHMQIICTLLQTANHAITPPLSFLRAGCPSCCPTNSVKALKAFVLDKRPLNYCSCSCYCLFLWGRNVTMMLTTWRVAGVSAVSFWRQDGHFASSATEHCQAGWTDCRLCSNKASRWLSQYGPFFSRWWPYLFLLIVTPHHAENLLKRWKWRCSLTNWEYAIPSNVLVV